MAATLFPWTAYQCSQSQILCICLVWMQEAMGEVSVGINHDVRHHFDSTSDPEPKNMSQVRWVLLFEATAICPWIAYQCAQTLFICLMWMQKVV